MDKWFYCPVCTNSLVKKENKFLCVKCGWDYYIHPIPSVAAFLMNEKDEILLIKRGVAPEKGKWALPSGFIEQSETPEQAVIRELKEETGLDCKIKGLLGIHIEPTKLYGDVLLLGYYVEFRGGRPKPNSDTIDARFFPKNRLPSIPFLSHRAIINQGINNSLSQRIYVEVLKSKIVEAIITHTVLFYEGSLGIDSEIMEKANIKPGEKVQVLNYDNGERLETYTIAERPGSKRFALYGPASLKGKIGQRVCILSYGFIPQVELGFFKPRIIILDKKNRIKKIKQG